MSKTTAVSGVDQTRLALSTDLVLSARAWRKTADHALSGFGISSSLALPLLMIGRLGEDGARQVTLAHAVGIEGPSLVRVLDQLCQAQLARRVEDPADKRAKLVSLTQAGRDLVLQIEEHLTQLRARMLKNVSHTDLEIALRVVRLFNGDAVGDAGGNLDDEHAGHPGGGTDLPDDHPAAPVVVRRHKSLS